MDRGLLLNASRLQRVAHFLHLPHRLHPPATHPSSEEPISISKLFRHGWSLLPAALFLAAGCATYVPLAVSPAANVSTLAGKSLSDSGLRGYIERNHSLPPGAWPPAAWTPDLLVLAARYHQPSLQVARSERNVAGAALVTASERPNPSISVGAEHKASSGTTSPWVTALSLDVPIETSGKRGERMKQARWMSLAAAADLQQAEWDARSKVLAALLDLAEARSSFAALGEQASVRDDIAAIYEKRLIVGAGSRPDLARARSEAMQSHNALLAADAGEAAALAALAAAIPVPVERVQEVTVDVSTLTGDPPPLEPLPRLREIALTNRPDIAAAAARFQAADSAYRLEIRRQYPDIHIAPGLGWDQGAFRWTVGASAELPLFNRHRGPIAEAAARRDVAASKLLALQARIAGALDRSVTDEAAARERLAAARRVARLQDERVVAVRRQFEAGEIDRLALRIEELQDAVARGELAASMGHLHQTLGAVEDVLAQPVPHSIEEQTP